MKTNTQMPVTRSIKKLINGKLMAEFSYNTWGERILKVMYNVQGCPHAAGAGRAGEVNNKHPTYLDHK